MTSPQSRPFTMPDHDTLETALDDLVVLPDHLYAQPPSDFMPEINVDKSLSDAERARQRVRHYREQLAYKVNGLLHGHDDDPKAGLWYQIYTLLASKEYTWNKELLTDIYALAHTLWDNLPKQTQQELDVASAIPRTILDMFDVLFDHDHRRRDDLRIRWSSMNTLPHTRYHSLFTKK